MAFDNDARSATEDRNLQVDEVVVACPCRRRDELCCCSEAAQRAFADWT